jgi:ABC-type sugar transport system ATPase subunit
LAADGFILEFREIGKSFPGVKALDDVSFKVRRGSVHALMGENGAGKSTLMKVLLGIYAKDSGNIFLQGNKLDINSPLEGLKNGIAMIHQELSAVQELTVYENIFLGKERTLGKTFLTDRKRMTRETTELFGKLNIKIDPAVKMSQLSVSQQQMCEIAKAISYDAELIIMDEPTSAITEAEVERLFRIIKDLTAKGITIIYITHKMDEVFKITDEITVLRDGKVIGTVNTSETSRDKLIEMMVGREIKNIFPKEEVFIGEVYFSVKSLCREGEFEDVSFDLRRGEILGVAGLMGAGRSEVMETIFGIRKKTNGRLYIEGKEVKINTPMDAIRNGIAFLTEDRKASGCFLPLSVLSNIAVASVDVYSKGSFFDYKKADEMALEMQKKLSIKTSSLDEKIINLSGGNQQKVLIARWLLTEFKILIVDEPTKGIDVGSKVEIHKLISGLAKEGKCIIMISSEIPEVLGMSDRIMVMSFGRLTGFLSRKDATQEKILLYATGVTE